MANSADPDHLASSETNWSGSTLFAKAGHVRVQQELGLPLEYLNLLPYWSKNLNYLNNLTICYMICSKKY